MNLVSAYSLRVYGAVTEQLAEDSVCSPLGVWVLLAGCLVLAEGEELAELEQAVGCSADQAGQLLEAFLSQPPLALNAAVALWTIPGDATAEVADALRRLPSAIESGFMPTQQKANGWADRETLGLIREFPLAVDQLRVALASALATRVSWAHPFDVAPVSEHFPTSSPWRQSVRRVLSTELTMNAGLVMTRAAGLVAVHEAEAEEDLTVISVSADPEVNRVTVLSATHEVAAHIYAGTELPRESLFDVSLGDGHSWTIVERERPAWRAGQQFESITSVALPQWQIRSEMSLLSAEVFAAAPAIEILRRLIGPRPDDQVDARQVAVASFDRYGFRAAAVTAFGIAASAMAPPTEIGLERTARLRFDHPYAAVAISGKPNSSSGSTRFQGLPLFSAWIQTPTDAEAEPASAT